MKILRSFYFIITSLLIFSSCINKEDKMEIESSASAFDIKQGEASITQSNQRYMKAFKASDSAEVSKCFSKEGKLMIADTPEIAGRDDIMRYFASLMNKGIKSFDLKSKKIWGDSSLLAEEGTYEMTDSNREKIDKGKYIVLWKPEGGNWKMYRDTYTSDIKRPVVVNKKKIAKKSNK